MSRVLTCSPAQSALSTNILRVKNFVRTNRIVSNGNLEINVEGLTPSVVVSNIPIDAGTFSADGESRIVFIADKRVRLVGVGEAHQFGGATDSQLLVKKNGSSLITVVDEINKGSGFPVSKVVNSANNIVNAGEFVSIELTGGLPTALVGGIITLTFNVL